MPRNGFDQVLVELGDPELRLCIERVRKYVSSVTKTIHKPDASRMNGKKTVAYFESFDLMHFVKYVLPAEVSSINTYDFLLSHTQCDPAAKLLATELYSVLAQAGKRCWLDVKMDRCDREAMRNGIANSRVFVAILTDDGANSYSSREMCRDEISWALNAPKLIVPVVSVEDKQRIGDFIAEGLRNGIDFRELNFCQYDRGGPEYAKASIRAIVQQGGISLS